MSFWELFVVGVIALIVLGPERLPKAARTVGLWVGKAKQGFNSIKNEIDRELKVQELQQQLQEQKQNLESQLGVDEIKETINDSQQSINNVSENLSNPLKNIGAIEEPAQSLKDTPNNKDNDPTAQ
ncbi:twin-arginine translocase subunit TatB [Aliikangiella marina]|uniref:Twin-arginine translocase subunit TatB n=1 Tax=Aliikangiella marina TaxID=1712262 RepID=A0A545TBP9_9GAMM|nr:Sec-independent protein translocase protein TatB [Aliikangiella marina]TQV74653.1 twin-arginine translocase subunit TatB [Aliikangiella marina]